MVSIDLLTTWGGETFLMLMGWNPTVALGLLSQKVNHHANIIHILTQLHLRKFPFPLKPIFILWKMQTVSNSFQKIISNRFEMSPRGAFIKQLGSLQSIVWTSAASCVFVHSFTHSTHLRSLSKIPPPSAMTRNREGCFFQGKGNKIK